MHLFIFFKVEKHPCAQKNLFLQGSAWPDSKYYWQRKSLLRLLSFASVMLIGRFLRAHLPQSQSSNVAVRCNALSGTSHQLSSSERDEKAAAGQVALKLPAQSQYDIDTLSSLHHLRPHCPKLQRQRAPHPLLPSQPLSLSPQKFCGSSGTLRIARFMRLVHPRPTRTRTHAHTPLVEFSHAYLTISRIAKHRTTIVFRAATALHG